VGIDMKDAFSQTLPQRAKRISARQYTPPSFEMSIARKDAPDGGGGRARRADAGDGAGAGELLDERIARGEGQLDVAAWVRVPD
jgi:hypothetical protein